ncbi:MAG: hypothetical protein KDC54_11285, partial [Lewinella sp.]|nr:hypothetical protein [Lewinella sp.]
MNQKKRTEGELLELQNQNLYLVDRLLRQANISEDDIGNLIPGLFHLNRRSDMVVEYLSSTGLAYFDRSLEEIRSMGLEFFERCLSRETREVVMPRFAEFSLKNDTRTIYSDFQVVRR